MKKLLFIFSFSLFLVSSLKAQSSNGASIISTLNDFDEKKNEHTMTETMRPWWQTVLNTCTVVSADGAGAVAGVRGTIIVAAGVGLATGGTGVIAVCTVVGAIAGAAASNGAYQGLNRIAPTQITYGGLNINLPSEYISYADIGKQHNEVIHNNFFNGDNLANFYTPLLNQEQIEIVQLQETTNTINYLKDWGRRYAESNFDFESYYNELIERNLMTTTSKDILNAFFNKYKNCASPKDMETLINLSLSLVANSELDEQEKQSLIAAFLVASESPFYLNPKDF